jgi:hypothetical protein
VGGRVLEKKNFEWNKYSLLNPNIKELREENCRILRELKFSVMGVKRWCKLLLLYMNGRLGSASFDLIHWSRITLEQQV